MSTKNNFLEPLWWERASLRLTGGCMLLSVPARLGKGQGAKELGHNLARERPKFGYNLVRKRHKTGHRLEHEWPSRAHFYAFDAVNVESIIHSDIPNYTKLAFSNLKTIKNDSFSANQRGDDRPLK